MQHYGRWRNKKGESGAHAPHPCHSPRLIRHLPLGAKRSAHQQPETHAGRAARSRGSFMAARATKPSEQRPKGKTGWPITPTRRAPPTHPSPRQCASAEWNPPSRAQSKVGFFLLLAWLSLFLCSSGRPVSRTALHCSAHVQPLDPPLHVLFLSWAPQRCPTLRGNTPALDPATRSPATRTFFSFIHSSFAKYYVIGDSAESAAWL
ncbi:hypothetical protein K437DRAFT_156807 [Tilletiaria anomala UBC 951]|uniref:Uncharacterized protein n=1 Tax=Tilletiaria anomala (strain ATCC 24038 / CBS 436.72 / UBC 951) TaxID=1037660 RepID=A0A066VMC2_TILAU|nr:uncharacterized protein K437DRAFT_156807 [Tilletiaria anomala UBC 951]KDN42867.1 hypothetical protein K437DRAFT_156807 [Tilletiaria anomala UBC 951]